jgi:hypothetical protein
MKRVLLYLGIALVLVTTCTALTLVWKRSHATRTVAQVAAPPKIAPGDWRVRNPDAGGKGRNRIELFRKSGECGFIERWGSDSPTHFVVFLLNHDHGDESLAATGNLDVVFVNSFDDLETAKRATERLCDKKD